MPQFSESLKQWRKHKGWSQMELSLQAQISSKHVSFLETGRANPSREMVLHLAQVLSIPLASRNVLLQQAGFSEAYSRLALEDDAMTPINQALELMLENHNPYPAMVFDWQWNVVRANASQQKLNTWLKQQNPNLLVSNNIMEMVFSPQGFRPYIDNWDDVARELLQRVKQEQDLYQDRQSDLYQRLLTLADKPKSWLNQGASERYPVIPIELSLGELKLKLFSTLSSFGTAIDVTLQELIIEQYFPMDDATREFFAYLQQTSE